MGTAAIWQRLVIAGGSFFLLGQLTMYSKAEYWKLLWKMESDLEQLAEAPAGRPWKSNFKLQEQSVLWQTAESQMKNSNV